MGRYSCLALGIERVDPPAPGGSQTSRRSCFMNRNSGIGSVVAATIQQLAMVSGCYSTSCAARDETRLETRLIPEESAIRFHGRFVLRDLTQHGYGADACTLDCKGGTLPFTITGVVSGTVYSVWLGDPRLGDFKASPEAPPRRSAPICFGSPSWRRRNPRTRLALLESSGICRASGQSSRVSSTRCICWAPC